MNILYTEETLIQFYYEECDILETIEIESTLESNLDANLQYADVYEHLLLLKSDILSPSKKSIDNILKASLVTYCQ